MNKCDKCKHKDVDFYEGPCLGCVENKNLPNKFESKKCKHVDMSPSDPGSVCNSCGKIFKSNKKDSWEEFLEWSGEKGWLCRTSYLDDEVRRGLLLGFIEEKNPDGSIWGDMDLPVTPKWKDLSIENLENIIKGKWKKR